MKQTAACGPRQFQVLVRTGRYGITPGTLWDFYTEHEILFHAYNISFRKLLSWKEYFYRETETAIWFYVCLFIFI